MSGEAVGWVVKHSPFKGVTFAVHLCIADSASDLHDYRFWMAMGTLSEKARCSRRSAGAAVDELAQHGFLDVLKPPVGDDGKPTGRPGLYHFLMPEGLPVVFEPSYAKRQEGAQSVRTPGAQPVRTGAQSGNAGCAEASHNTNEPKLNKTADSASCEQCHGTGWYVPDTDDRHQPARKCDHRIGALAGGQPIEGAP